MTAKIRTVVTFESSLFNTSDPKDYFINPCCFGDDVAVWLAQQLRAKGYEKESLARKTLAGTSLSASLESNIAS
jgi:hypothetical protein